MCEEVVGISPTSSRNPEVHGYVYSRHDLVGGNMHFPGADDTLVAFTWRSTERLTEEHIQRRQYRLAFESEFVREAKARVENSGGRLHFLLWPRQSSGEGDGYFPRSDTISVNSSNAYIIWLPGDYECIEEMLHSVLTFGSSGGISLVGTREGNSFWDGVMSFFQSGIEEGFLVETLGAERFRSLSTLIPSNCVSFLPWSVFLCRLRSSCRS